MGFDFWTIITLCPDPQIDVFEIPSQGGPRTVEGDSFKGFRVFPLRGSCVGSENERIALILRIVTLGFEFWIIITLCPDPKKIDVFEIPSQGGPRTVERDSFKGEK